MASIAEVEAYISKAARARGIPEAIAIGVAKAESGLSSGSEGDWWVDFAHYPAGTKVIAKTANGVIVPKGTPGAVPTSFGPFQLRAGKTVTGYADEAGLGDSAIAAGIDVRDPSTWPAQVEYALDTAAARGTFAGIWSTATGALGATFPGSVASGPGVPGIGPLPSLPGAPIPAVPGMPGGSGSGGVPGSQTPAPSPYAVPNPKDIATAISDNMGTAVSNLAVTVKDAATGVIAPFTTLVNDLVALATFLGQPHIYERVGLGVFGAILILLGLVLFALSFVDKLPGIG